MKAILFKIVSDTMSSSEEEVFEAASDDEDNDSDEELSDKVDLTAENQCQLKEKVVDRINSIFGADLGNLEKVNDLHRELIDKFDELDRKLNVANAETPSQLHKSLRTGELRVCLRHLDTIIDNCLLEIFHLIMLSLSL